MTRLRTVNLGAGLGEITVDDDRPQQTISGPGHALSFHLELHRWMRTETAWAVHEHHYRVLGGDKTRGMDPSWMAAHDAFHNPRHLLNATDGRVAIGVATLDVAETVFVGREMQHAVDLIADRFDTASPDGRFPVLALTDVPDEAGLIVYEDPWIAYPNDDVLGELARVRAVTWRLVKPGYPNIAVRLKGRPAEVAITSATHRDDDSVSQVPMELLIEHGGVLCQIFYDGPHYISTEDQWRMYERPPALPASWIALPFAPIDEFNAAGRPLTPEYRGVQRRVLALFRLWWQRILSREPWPVDRAGRRRWGRQMSGEIKVTHVRRFVPRHRPSDPDRPETSDRRLAYTIAVKGHARDQWYRTLGPAYLEDGTWNPDSHRRIWIEPHLRGDGPMAEPKFSVTAVVR